MVHHQLIIITLVYREARFYNELCHQKPHLFSGRVCTCLHIATGYYMYIETSVPASLNDRASLISPLYPEPPTARCNISFWYHMYGTTINSLALVLVRSFAPDKVLLNITGNKGNKWLRASVRLPSFKGYYQVSKISKILPGITRLAQEWHTACEVYECLLVSALKKASLGERNMVTMAVISFSIEITGTEFGDWHLWQFAMLTFLFTVR